MPTNPEPPRHFWIGPGKSFCKSTAGSPIDPSCWSPIAHFAAIEFLAAVRNHVCVVTRLRLDANLFAFPPPKRKGRGRPSLKGKPLKKLAAVLRDRRISWQRYRVSIWYGRTNRLVEVATGTALW